MKFYTLVALVVVILVATVSGQRGRRCLQRARPPTCVGERDVGTACGTAPARRMWYYNRTNRTCIAMQHLGCGGNSNRWCTRRACERRCNRPTTTT